MTIFDFDSLFHQTGGDNLDGVNYGDYFYAIIDGHNVILRVCFEAEHKVCVYELKLKEKKIKLEDGTREVVDVLCKGLVPATETILVPVAKNSPSKSDYWVQTKDGKLIIEKNYSRYYEATKLEEETKNGLLNYYWRKIENE